MYFILVVYMVTGISIVDYFLREVELNEKCGGPRQALLL